MSSLALSNEILVQWSDKITDPVYANQSACLFTTYHLHEMLIYRPFIIRPSYSGHSSSFPWPALQICTKAAHAVARIIKVQTPKGFWNVPLLVTAIQHTVGVLLLNVWDLKARERAVLVEDLRAPVTQALEPLLEDINMLMDVLESVEPRFEFAGQVLYVSVFQAVRRTVVHTFCFSGSNYEHRCQILTWTSTCGMLTIFSIHGCTRQTLQATILDLPFLL
jgi:hypothetical protein